MDISARRSRLSLQLTFHRKKLLIAYLFVLPSILYFTFFFIFPVLQAFSRSFTRWALITPPSYVGLENYARLLQDRQFQNSLLVTLYYTAGVVVITTVLSLGLAVLLQRSWRFRSIIRISYFVPLVIPLFIVGVIGNYAFNQSFGFIPEVTSLLGLGRSAWLSVPSLAMPALIMVGIWRMLGFDIILFLAGLQGIPEELYEVASIDGADSWAEFRFITLPLLRRTTILVLVVTVISNMQAFDLVYSMTLGGPGEATRVLMLNIYETGFRHLRMGYALAQAMVLFVLMFGISLLQLFILRGYSSD
ncbi:MAG: sugar ABC transporter permease [Chloroflexi bacterium]|nr:sugar ABC transporter permease [Chloroflexota bacterium]